MSTITTFATASTHSDMIMNGQNNNPDFAFDHKQWQRFEESLNAAEKEGSISMSDLLALIAEITEASHKLRSQIMQNRISEAVATMDVAHAIAVDKKFDAILKYALTIGFKAANIATTVITATWSAKTQTLTDEKLVHLDGNKKAKVSDLTAAEMNSDAAILQQKHSSRMQSVNHGFNTLWDGAGDVVKAVDAAQVCGQEEAAAVKELKQKFDAQLDQYIQNLTAEAVALNQILDTMARASLATNR